MNPSTHLLNCQVCQCRLELHSSLCSADVGDETKQSYCDLSEIDLQLKNAVECQAGNLLELLCSSSNPLQIPLCKKCASTVSAELNKQLSELELECVNYKQALDKLLSRKASSEFDESTAKRTLDGLKKEESELLEELKRLEHEEKLLCDELERKLQEQTARKEQDGELYRKLRDNHRKLIEQSEQQRSLKAQIKFIDDQLRKLIRVNVLDMTFFIWKDGDYGTINGLRLGRLRHELVDWNEINAAFGQIALLLQVLAERLEMKFQSYEMFPCGSYSFIRVTRPGGKSEDLPLYGSGGWRPFGQTALDQAIVAYLDCFCQLENVLKTKFPPATQVLPYRMIKDKIVDKESQYLVKMQLNSEERWTKAMKCLLLNLKRAIGIVVNLRPTLSALPSLAAYTKGSGASSTSTVVGFTTASSTATSA